MIALYAITTLLTTTLLVVAGALELRNTEDLSARIVGCADVECPTAGGESTVSNCTVGDRSFSSVGLARIPFDSESDLNLTGISWVQGSSIVDNSGGDGRNFSSTFFLGTPPSFTLPDGLRGCAVFLLGAKGNIDFPGGPAEEVEGTCSDAMNDECIAALITQAESFGFGHDDDDACEALQQDLARNFDTACRSAAGGDSWGDIMAAPVLGPGAPEPISESENSTSNCWPILPKQDNLTTIDTVSAESAEFGVNAVAEWFFGVTPILTVFYSGNSSNITGSAQLTCLKTIGPSAEAIDAQAEGATGSTMPTGDARAIGLVGGLMIAIWML